MALKVPEFPLKTIAFFMVLFVLLGAAGFLLFRKLKQSERGFYTIAVFYNSNNQSLEDQQLTKFIIDKKVTDINENGGIAGRPLRIKYLNDKGDPDTTLKHVIATIKDENLIAYLGCWGSTKAIAVAKEIGKGNIPFIGGYSVTDLAKPYPNMYSYEINVKQFAFSAYNLLKAKSKRVAFIGNTGDVFSETLLKLIKVLNRKEPGFELVMEKWYPVSHQFTAAELDRLSDSLKTQADFLFLSTTLNHTNAILRNLWRHKTKMPVFCAFNDIPEIDSSIPGFKEAELYDISVLGIPSALNLRTQLLKDLYKGQLQENTKLDFQLGFSALIADGIGLVQAAAQLGSRYPDKTIREKINAGLKYYINGVRIYRGMVADWYFTSDRALVNEAVLGWKPANSDKPILAPYQFLRDDTSLKKTQVLYTNIDLIRIDRINDEEGSFNARFYLEINSKRNFPINQIDFANAVRNEINREPLLDIKLLRTDSATGEAQLYNRLFKVSGKFFFTRNLKNYPFDQQQFTITLQTNSAFEPFLIQPPGQFQRDTIFASPGWQYVSNFIGYDQDIIYTARNFISQQAHIPYYKFNYTFVLKRVQIDFFLKVFTPLLAILIITYFSVYIPYREFEALAGIQVTALLSAIALYFSSYKPELQNATVSDKIFIFTYIMITTLIGTSILLYSLHYKKKELDTLGKISRFYQLYIFPAIVIGFTIFAQLYH
jgi:hypothetical protein